MLDFVAKTVSFQLFSKTAKYITKLLISFLTYLKINYFLNYIIYKLKIKCTLKIFYRILLFFSCKKQFFRTWALENCLILEMECPSDHNTVKHNDLYPPKQFKLIKQVLSGLNNGSFFSQVSGSYFKSLLR